MLQKSKYCLTFFIVAVMATALFISPAIAQEGEKQSLQDEVKGQSPGGDFSLFSPNLGVHIPISVFEVESASGSSTEGTLAGFGFSLESITPAGYYRFYFDSMFGEVESDSKVVVADTTVVDTFFAAGFTIPGQDRLLFSFYGGLGIKAELFDHTNEANAVEEERIVYFYLTPGARVDLLLSPNIKVGLDLSLRVLAAGEYSIKTNAGEGEVDLEPTVGVRLEVPVDFKIGKKISFHLSLWYDFISLEAEDSPVSAEDDFHFIGFYVGFKFLI